MSKQRQIKILSIVALVLAVTAMTLGFAAFSTTLNISSSASVTPNSNDFKVVMYGFNDSASYDAFVAGGKVFNLDYVNTTSAYGVSFNDNIEFNDLILDNNTYLIKTSGIKVNDNASSVTFHILLRNEGEYDAYVDINEFKYNSSYSAYYHYITGTCVPEDGTDPELTAAACSNIQLVTLFTPIGNCVIDENSKTYLIPKGEYGVLSVTIGAISSDVYADGPFLVVFPDYKLNISTAK